MQGTKLQEADNSKEFMDASLMRKLAVLEKEVTDIKSEIETRTLMHTSILNELKQGLEGREMQIKGFGGWNYGTIFESRIMALEREINDLRKETRFEELNYWRDISKLRESMRRVLKEIWQIHGRKEFLSNYLDKLTRIEW